MQHRILHIIPTLDRSGAEKQLTFLARGLPREELAVHVCALTRGGPFQRELEAAGVPVTVIHKRGKLDLRAYRRLKDLVASLRPELIHTWLFAGNAYGRLAVVGLRSLVFGLWSSHPRPEAKDLRRKTPILVASERCVDSWKSWLHLWIDRRLARRTACIVANSRGVRDFYLARGLPAEKFEVIPNGVEATGGAGQQSRLPSPIPRSEVLAELGLPAHARLVGLIGRLWPQKRVKDAIWAADLLKVARGGVHLLIVGDGPHRARLETFRDQVEIRDKVHFLGTRDDVPRLLPHFDVLWSPSAFEGQSNTIMEALVAGVPVVATDIPGTRDLIEHGVTGYLVPTEGRPATAATVNTSVAKGLAKYTNILLDDAALADRIGLAARERMLSEFGVESMVDRYAALYRRLLG